MASLQGKVIAITGAASGMGAATARIAAERGAFLSLADVNPESLKTIVDELKTAGTNVIGFPWISQMILALRTGFLRLSNTLAAWTGRRMWPA